jgi:hypothetical protein
MEVNDLLLIKDGAFEPLTPQQKLQLLIVHTIIDPGKFKFVDERCNEIWGDGLFYVRNQETYDKCIEEYKRECGLEDSQD